MTRTILLATEKPFASSAVDGIESIFREAGYTLQKLEGYKEKEQLWVGCLFHLLLMAAVEQAEGVIIRSDKADQDFFDKAKNLKVIVRAGAGVDNIDLSSASAHGVSAMNTPGQNSNAVAELAFGMMLAHARNHWDGTTGGELRGKTLGLWGCGNVGVYMAKVAEGLGMKVIGFDPFKASAEISEMGVEVVDKVEEVFKADFVSLHIPATEQTKQAVNMELLSLLPKKGTLVNTARKEVIHEEDLKNFLASRGDCSYLSDVAPDNLADLCAALGSNVKRQVLCTAKKMGAQTTEANNNAGLAAARQIVDFFEKNDRRFQVNKM